MRRAIVCTGLIRNPEKFNAFLDRIASLDPSARADLTVFFSTWVDELNAYPEIRKRLRVHPGSLSALAEPSEHESD